MSRDVLTVGYTMRIPLLYGGEYSQWVESNKTAKDFWDALARHMLGSKYGEKDRKAIVLYEYERFKATEGELLLDTYIRYLQVINDLKKSKEKVVVSSNSKGSEAGDFSELKKITTLLAKAFNRRKFYSKPTQQLENIIIFSICKQETRVSQD
nr:hypothetical protein [Tanacetum cinerariifolium]